jgi:hypothetical protein
VRDAFAAEYSLLGKLWEAISPDPMLLPFEADYRWLTQVYVSVQPTSGTGKLLWHALGAKTIELIHQNVHVDAVRDDLETLVLDAELLEAVVGSPNPKIVRLVRFPGWQNTAAGERQVKKALRRGLLEYQLHQDVELFDRAYGYIRQYD